MGIGFVNYFKATSHFPIKVVKVVGAHHISHQAIQHSLSPLVSRGFFGVEVDAIKDKLLQVSWISDVSVKRVWPNEIVVMITEKNPVANWNNTSLLSSAGELFVPESGKAPELPEFFGPDGTQLILMQYYQKMNTILSSLHFKVARLEFTPGHLWNVTLDNGMKLTIANKDLLTRFSHFVKVYPKIIGDRAIDIDYVDLRYPNGLAVRWKSVTQNV